jgi:serine/threonine protein kinase
VHVDKLFIAVETGKAIAFCHKSNLIHRDLKPHNILLQYNAKRKLTNVKL